MVGLQPNEDYAFVKVENETWVIGKNQTRRIYERNKKLKIMKLFKIVKRCRVLKVKKYIHPLLDLIPELNYCF